MTYTFVPVESVESVESCIPIFEDKDLVRYISIHEAHTVEEVTEEIRRLSRKPGERYYFLMKDAKPIGVYYTYGYSERHSRISIGLGIIHNECQGGVGKKVTSLILDQVRLMGIHRVQAEVEATNTRSLSTLIRHEFLIEGYLRDIYRNEDGTYTDYYLLSKLL